jgi:hypothetical protein
MTTAVASERVTGNVGGPGSDFGGGWRLVSSLIKKYLAPGFGRYPSP